MFRTYHKWIGVWATIWRIALLLVVLMAGLTVREQPAAADETVKQPLSAPDAAHKIFLPSISRRSGDFPSCRLGVGVTRNPVATYDVAQFRLGWYVDWRASPGPSSTLEYYHTIRVRQDRSADGAYLPSYTITPRLNFGPSGLGPIVRANPGHVWLIGNEPDRPDSQDDAMPDLYAEIYHEAYYFIKGIDPTARVAIGAVVQPTPLRLEYLQHVLAAYQAKYDARLPVDVWNTHLYIVREVKGEWGGDVPPGSDAQSGRVYTLRDHLDISIFKSLVTELRTWMKANGYQDVPLVVTEYGVLMPLWFLDDVGYTQADVNRFLLDAVNYLDSAADPNLGYAADGNRLVQRAALYSLDDDGTFPDGSLHWGSFLLRSSPPYAVTETGAYFRDVIAASARPTVDFLPYRVITGPLITGNQPTVSPVVKVLVANAGNSSPNAPIIVRLFDTTGDQRVQVGSDVAIPPFTGCGTLREVNVVWPDLGPGQHTLAVEIDPGNQIGEVLETNNTMVTKVWVGTRGIYLPLVRR
jgi:hypothetical protein